ncbi:YraN family protein [Microbacterium sp. SORGH_AS_0888]|uniref:YraN family protein n=1 Tax=Microbacterium sp. SORGH_AS_0888 TaxID=3041791 RepID=UPI002787B47C|nr:YraN family protein [Microbacterium sp. SORGH_AS_0888]MDQ1128796.1 putative endonuclease [Microbacterium sp. SORGH_AS_0888]
MAEKDELGRRGEQAAADYLIGCGWRILQRNWRCPAGELDIVAHDGTEIVVVEVKTRRSDLFGHPFEAVDARKRARLWRLALAWCTAHPVLARGTRIRVDAIALLGTGPFRIEHLRDLR